MNKVMGIFVLLMFMVCGFAAAQAPVSSPVVSVVSVPVTSAAPVSLFDFVKSNIIAIALAVYAVLDLIVLFSPKLAGNGIVHQILIVSAKAAGITPPAAS